MLILVLGVWYCNFVMLCSIYIHIWHIISQTMLWWKTQTWKPKLLSIFRPPTVSKRWRTNLWVFCQCLFFHIILFSLIILVLCKSCIIANRLLFLNAFTQGVVFCIFVSICYAEPSWSFFCILYFHILLMNHEELEHKCSATLKRQRMKCENSKIWQPSFKHGFYQ